MAEQLCSLIYSNEAKQVQLQHKKERGGLAPNKVSALTSGSFIACGHSSKAYRWHNCRWLQAYLLLTCDRLSSETLISNMKAQRKALCGRVEPEISHCEQSAVQSDHTTLWLLNAPLKPVFNPNTCALFASVGLTDRCKFQGMRRL